MGMPAPRAIGCHVSGCIRRYQFPGRQVLGETGPSATPTSRDALAEAGDLLFSACPGEPSCCPVDPPDPTGACSRRKTILGTLFMISASGRRRSPARRPAPHNWRRPSKESCRGSGGQLHRVSMKLLVEVRSWEEAVVAAVGVETSVDGDAHSQVVPVSFSIHSLLLFPHSLTD